MAMTILNNSAANMTLGELNKNINKVGKQLTRLATGQRITGASEDSASFAISEKMREQIRSLEQDIQNVQNGSSMLKTAHGGIENIVEELRSLKELAINAANDSNTDADRAIIQKEFDKRRETIDDIATSTNYNTKPLLDGTYFRPRQITILDKIARYVTTTSEVEVVEGADDEESSAGALGGTVNTDGSFTSGVTGFFSGLDTVTMNGKTASSLTWVNGKEAYGSNTNPSRNYGGVPANQWTTLDFSGLQAREGGTLSSVADMDQQGFSILCTNKYDWCPSFHGFVFDADIPVGSGEKVLNTSGPVYKIGIKGIDTETDYDDEGNITGTKSLSVEEWKSSLTSAFFSGVRSAIRNTQVPNSRETVSSNYDSRTGTTTTTIALGGHGDAVDIRCVEDSEGNTTFSLTQHYPYWIYEGYDMAAVYEEAPPPPKTTMKTVSSTYIEYVEKAFKVNEYNPLTIHHGTHANQRTNFFINDMHTKSLKGKIPSDDDIGRINALGVDREKQEDFLNLLYEAKQKNLDQASVRTQRDANVTIKIVDSAIDYALNEATYMGAYLQRLEYTESNVTTQDENTQNAESTIRDADMAKEMTEYTKQNVLSQAAQSMLAQANQNMSSVLGLLQ